jgi:NAD-dependent dihydropyrimidine dehydrogenase PreA subunit
MKRKIVKIDAEKCIGCGICVDACQEGAIGMVDGKAMLLRDDYCDGLGNCLPACPSDAISIEEREADAFDEVAVGKAQKKATLACGCPGGQAHAIQREARAKTTKPETVTNDSRTSELGQWPVQIKLVPANAPYFNNASLLIAADCTAFAYARFHANFIRGRIALIGCPKLDDTDYSEKLEEIIRCNEIKSITVARMEVPCCGGIEHAVIKALRESGKMIPWHVVVISTDGIIVEEK